jgi:hypothetical protein
MEDYYADPCATPSLSQSIAKVLVTQSPLHAWQEHPRLGGGSDRWTRSTDRGSVLGAMLLGTSGDVVEVVPEVVNYRTKDAKAQRDAVRDRGKVPVLERELDAYSEALEKIRGRFAEQGIRFTGESEVKVEWTEESTGGPVLCRGAMDHLILADGIAWDLKSIVSAHPDKCQRHMDEYGYDIQWAAYTSALRKLGVKRPDLGFLFFEPTPPYAINLVRPSESMRQLGGLRWERGVNTWARCRKQDRWPGYDSAGWTTIEARHWVLANEMARVA